MQPARHRNFVVVLLLSVSTVFWTMVSDASPAAVEPTESRTEVVILGSGNPFPDPERHGPSVMIRVDGVPYLVDAGAGVVRRAARTFDESSSPRIRQGVTQLRIAFITHLHSDHTLGLPDLMWTPWIIGRTEPLELYGPPGLENMVKNLRQAYEQDLEIRTQGLEKGNLTGHRANVHELESEALPAVVYRDDLVKVTAFPVNHGTWEHAYGYRFETPDRTIVISGDLAPSESVIEACDGCDVLMHEVYPMALHHNLTPDQQAYLETFHTSSEELAEIAEKARPKLLLLYHQLFFGGMAGEEELLKELRSLYDGEVISGRDLGVY